MTRKDTILIAVVINAGLLAVLFITAVIYDTEKELASTELIAQLPSSELGTSTPSLPVVVPSSPVEESGLRYCPPLFESRPEVEEGYLRDLATVSKDISHKETKETEGLPLESSDAWVEVKVKKGDALEKIARLHNTTVSAIKKENRLQSEHLSVGQTLKIPVKKSSAAELTNIDKSPPTQERGSSTGSKETSSAVEPQYYTIKSGDNPWKIAKECHVKYEDILRLNGLDEEKARTLKIGDRIRVK